MNGKQTFIVAGVGVAGITTIVATAVCACKTVDGIVRVIKNVVDGFGNAATEIVSDVLKQE